MEIILLQISIKVMFLELFEDPAHCIYVWLARIFGIKLNVIPVDNDKNILFLDKDFVDVTLKASCSNEPLKENYLIFKMTLPNAERSFSFITLLNFHLMIITSQV